MTKWLRVLIAAALLGLLGFYPLLAPPPHRIDEQHFELIQKGMALADVEAIFGQPPGNYDWAVADDVGVGLWRGAAAAYTLNFFNSSTIVVDAFSSDSLWVDLTTATSPNATKTRFVTTIFLHSRIPGNVKTWTSRHGSCTIWFDEQERVSHKTDWQESRVEPPWNKWWKKWFGK